LSRGCGGRDRGQPAPPVVDIRATSMRTWAREVPPRLVLPGMTLRRYVVAA
jgi:hypothetical protein